MSQTRIACSPLTGRIYQGRVNGAAFVGQKRDVTSDVLRVVIEKAAYHGGAFEIEGGGEKWVVTVAQDAPTAPARQEWQPIETAPRDGTAFRGFHESLIDLDFNPCGSVECAWDGEQFIGCVWNGQQDAWYGKPVNLSHWQPLPAAPITAAPAEGEKR